MLRFRRIAVNATDDVRQGSGTIDNLVVLITSLLVLTPSVWPSWCTAATGPSDAELNVLVSGMGDFRWDQPVARSYAGT